MINKLNTYKNNEYSYLLNTNNKALIVSELNGKVAEHLNMAIVSINNNNIQEKHNRLNKAMKIIEEGLLSCLVDVENSNMGENLRNFYLSSLVVITKSNVNNNTEDLKKISGLFTDFKEVWKEIS